MKLQLFILLVLSSLSCYSENEFIGALDRNDLAKIKSLYDSKPETINKEREYAVYPMYDAAAKNKMDIVKYFIEKGAKVDLKTSRDGDNVILYITRTFQSPSDAAKKQYMAMLEYFAGLKATFAVADKEGTGSIKLLASRSVRTTDVKNFMEIVNFYIKNGAKLSDKSNSCILHDLMKMPGIPIAEKKFDFGNFEVAKEFIALGANVNETDSAKNTPLHVLLLNAGIDDDSKADMVKFLIEKGASTKVKNASKQSPEDLVKKDSPLRDILKKTKPKK